MQGANLNDIRESFESARSAKGRSSILNNMGANAAPSSGQPNDNFEIHKLRSSARDHKEPQVRDNDLSDVVSLHMPDGSTYEGTVDKQTQLKHGFGTQIWPDAAKYVGEWRDGKAEGKGTFYHSNGDLFEG